MDIFRQARQNFLRRQQESEDADLERQQAREQAQNHAQAQREAASPPMQEVEERSPSGSMMQRFANLRRPTIPSFISRRSSRQTAPRPSSSHYDDEGLESPKTPRFSLGMPHLPSTRLHLPNLSRTWTQGSNGPESPPDTARAHSRQARSRAGSTPEVLTDERVAEPVPTVPAEHIHGHSRTRSVPEHFDGADPAELHLASMAEDGRRRRRRGNSGSDRDREHDRDRARDRRRRRHRDGRDGRERRHPKRFLLCFPWIRSRRMRTEILRCFVSGIFLALLLSVYLALSITKNINNSEFTVLIILIILFTTIFFCHGLIRLCMLIVKPPQPASRQDPMAQLYGPGGYAIPSRPIRVTLARDEEAVGVESEATTGKVKPPAYGLWRESVRVDPNRIFWQRNETVPEVVDEEARPTSQGQTAPRPPSYASDDGITYVVEAQPRSIAPTTDVPLPQHPSETGRIGRPAEW